MDTSISSTQDFSIAELLSSLHQQDRELAKKARTVLNELVRELKPILRYIAGPYGVTSRTGHTVRVVLLGKMRIGSSPWLCLDEEGEFFTSSYSDATGHQHRDDCRNEHFSERPEESCSFRFVIENLREALEQAVEKREAHLASLRKRSMMLDEVLEVMKRHSP